MTRLTTTASTLLALLLALTIPATALGGSPFRYRVLTDKCRGTDRPVTLTLKVRVKELGVSGANYFRVRTKALEHYGGSWHTVNDWGWEYSTGFPDDADNYYHDRGHTHELNGAHDAAKLKMRVQVWSNSQGLLDEKTIVGKLCQAYLP